MSETQTTSVTAPKPRPGLPAYFNQGMVAVMLEAERRDVGYAHYWIKSTDDNRQVRRSMGWEPCEDKAHLSDIGLKDLIKEDNRAHFMDTELWRMPRELQDVIREAQSERQAGRSDALRGALEAMAEDAKGRSGGKVVPYMGSGMQGDLLTRTPVASPVDKK